MTRLALAFLGVTLLALALLSGLVLLAARQDVSNLVREDEERAVITAADLTAVAFTDAGGWEGADLGGVVTVADEHDAAVTVHNAFGELVSEPTGARPTGRVWTQPVLVDDEQVGTVTLRFRSTDLPIPERQLWDALTRQVVASTAFAVLVAVTAAVLTARRITRPIVAVSRAAQARERGDHTARAGDTGASGELGELAASFDRMVDTIERGESLRRGLLADVAHELRTPLALLQANLEAMVDRVVEPTPEEVARIRDDVLRLGRIVDDLETVAHAEAASLRLETGPVDLADVAASAIDRLAPHFEAAGLEVDVQLAPIVVAGDAHRLHQVVTNLLTNALKFTPAGGSVHVGVEGVDATARLQVADTGVGIPAEDLPHVFERFWRSGRAGATAGSGLGLTVVAELVRAHGGTVSLESEPQRGTRVSVSLPRV